MSRHPGAGNDEVDPSQQRLWIRLRPPLDRDIGQTGSLRREGLKGLAVRYADMAATLCDATRHTDAGAFKANDQNSFACQIHLLSPHRRLTLSQLEGTQRTERTNNRHNPETHNN